MSLLERIHSLLESDFNIAYFCKFDRNGAGTGTEKLYYGRDAFFCNDEIDERVSGILEDAFRNGPDIPVVFPYDFISLVFPMSEIRRSGWPLLMGFIPENSEESTYTRNQNSFDGYRAQAEYDPVFGNMVASLKSRIIQGEILQGVLSRRTELTSVDPVERIRRFLKSDRSLYVFMYRIGKFTVLGSSPENLVTVSGSEAEIFPIAGTVPRGESDEEDNRLGLKLMSSEKDKLEHRMLVDLARNDLGKISEDGSVEVTSSMELRKYATVQHLVSRVVSRMPESTGPLSIVRAVFPAGTVSGAPKKRAAELIDRMEPVPRGGYAGAAGVIGRETLDLALCIRSLFSSGESYYAQAGAGIVKDSEPEMESREVMSKLLSATGGIEDECIDC